jgi:hypothetical protein
MKEIWDAFLNAAEVDKAVVDIYDRVPNLFNNNKHFEPTVSKYLFDNGFRPQYPGNKSFAVAVSHDIDSLACDDLDLFPVKHVGGVKSALQVLKNEFVNSYRMRTKKAERDYIPKGMRELAYVEEHNHIPASYYFLSLLPGEEDFSYKVQSIRHVFDSVRKVGGEIGLHGGHLAYASASKISDEKKRLETAAGVEVKGYRNHYLRFDRSVTWRALAANQFVYDTTYGDAYSPGFRNGMCHPFRPFDHLTNDFINIVEIPLVYMDCSPSKYMFLDEDNSWRLFCSLVEKVRAVNGVFTLLWHNTSLDAAGRAFYHKAIQHLKMLDPWFATGSQISEHYIEKGYLDTISSMIIDVKYEGN